ncbi:acetyl-CoA synthetase-like protein [Gymnopus androsaceus JB14]|uniref:Acetyl-CoA synthetase-like protein n=1 Tax=Gymnopus androsaceus JB14 TaxID=1447944 RepID=A0A6A4HRY3_9AGAR|nr:acetyl-CoA synthetase-like protein [Gymnopus androsaceus JB14]
MNWTPKRSLSETEKLLCGPGELHELETRFIDGRLQRTYRNIWPSIRNFWAWVVEQHADKAYLVFEGRRLSYREMNARAEQAASMFYNAYHVRKGHKIGICSRNCVDWLVAWWASQKLGAVVVCLNAWLPLEPLTFCITHTDCKLVILDAERAEKLEPVVDKLYSEHSVTGILVLNSQEGKSRWKRMDSFDEALKNESGSPPFEENVLPEDEAVIMFTSGTTGLPKGVLSTQRQFLTNVLNTQVGPRRAILRRGENLDPPPEGPQKGALIAVPLFHVTGLTSYTMLASMAGMKIVLMGKWIPQEAVKLIQSENVGLAGGVPAMVSDLLDSPLVGHPLEGLFFGGSPASELLPSQAQAAFPTARLSQAYGLTETNSVAVGIAGEDYLIRPGSCGLPCPVNDMMIVVDDRVASPGEIGEVYLRGPNVMRGYYRDSEATSQVMTRDGWLRTGDVGIMDEEGFLYIKDRIKDIIIRGGENIASISVENALYADPRILEAAAVGVPDKRLGELVAAVVSVKPTHTGKVTESSLIEGVRKRLPPFAVPVMILVREEPFELTPSGKIMKDQLRRLAREQWKSRKPTISKSRRANL